MEKLKLNIKNTIFVGLAFASIQAFWESYNYIIPQMLNRTYGLTDSVRGLIMGLDNILALFLLPLFGRLSDRTNTRFGKRTPYFILGTLLSVVLFILLPVMENAQLKKVEEISETITQTELWEYVGKNEKAQLLESRAGEFDPTGKSEAEIDAYLKSEFEAIEEIVIVDGKEKTSEDYLSFVRPAFRAYIYDNVTKKNPTSLIIYIVLVFFLLVAMGTYRSPAVALMPDVTPEPLRSPANSIINLMGGIGTVLAMVVRTVLFATASKGFYAGYSTVVLATDALMLIFFVIFMLTVKENKLLQERERICEKFGIVEGIDAHASKEKVRLRDLPWKQMKYFVLALFAIALSTMGTDAINSNFSVYTTENLHFENSIASLVKTIAMVFSAVAFIPVGYMAYKLGRKKTIMIGFGCVAASLFFGYFIGPSNRNWFIVSYFLMSFGSVIFTVNTLPLVLEKSDSNTVGTFTGFYYVATMTAAAISPYLCGLVTEQFTRRSMFIYSTICMLLAMLILYFVKGIGEKRRIKQIEAE
jgi:maltose/moltooligosaccharide transporter